MEATLALSDVLGGFLSPPPHPTVEFLLARAITQPGAQPGGGRARTADASMPPPEQLAAMVEEHADAVYRVALSIVRDRHLAEDIAQDALIKAWTALPSYRGDSPMRNWILRITHNTAVSTLRRVRDESRDPEMLPERIQTGSVERSVEDRFSIAAFEEALGQLDELSRSIVILRELENLSYEEIAEVADVPMSTVKTRLLRSRRVLMVALEDWRP